MEKRSGKSNLGDYYYVPRDIKSSKDINTEQKFQLTLYGIILENLQGVFPDEVGVINKEHKNIFFSPDDKFREKTISKVCEITNLMKGNKPPLKFTSTYKQTPWFDKCLKETEKVNDIALIYKLDARSHGTLRENGIKTVKEFTECDINCLPKVPYASITTLERAKLQAQSLIGNKLVWLKEPNIPKADLKIYFDIEGDPLLQVEYLFGFWMVGDPEKKYAKFGKVVDYEKEGKYFLYFLAESPVKEKDMWSDFLKWVEILPKNNFIVYHFADYERSRTINLSKKYKTTDSFSNFLSKYVDLLKVVQESVIFPLYFYSIKDIAKSKFIDYKWRHEKAGGAQSIFWYEKWLESEDKKVLQDIIDYNEDDVQATEFLHKWLINSHD